jgi:hypothetical protein
MRSSSASPCAAATSRPSGRTTPPAPPSRCRGRGSGRGGRAAARPHRVAPAPLEAGLALGHERHARWAAEPNPVAVERLLDGVGRVRGQRKGRRRPRAGRAADDHGTVCAAYTPALTPALGPAPSLDREVDGRHGRGGAPGGEPHRRSGRGPGECRGLAHRGAEVRRFPPSDERGRIAVRVGAVGLDADRRLELVQPEHAGVRQRQPGALGGRGGRGRRPGGARRVRARSRGAHRECEGGRRSGSPPGTVSHG